MATAERCWVARWLGPAGAALGRGACAPTAALGVLGPRGWGWGPFPPAHGQLPVCIANSCRGDLTAALPLGTGVGEGAVSHSLSLSLLPSPHSDPTGLCPLPPPPCSSSGPRAPAPALAPGGGAGPLGAPPLAYLRGVRPRGLGGCGGPAFPRLPCRHAFRTLFVISLPGLPAKRPRPGRFS